MRNEFRELLKSALTFQAVNGVEEIPPGENAHKPPEAIAISPGIESRRAVQSAVAVLIDVLDRLSDLSPAKLRQHLNLIGGVLLGEEALAQDLSTVLGEILEQPDVAGRWGNALFEVISALNQNSQVTKPPLDSIAATAQAFDAAAHSAGPACPVEKQPRDETPKQSDRPTQSNSAAGIDRSWLRFRQCLLSLATRDEGPVHLNAECEILYEAFDLVHDRSEGGFAALDRRITRFLSELEELHALQPTQPSNLPHPLWMFRIRMSPTLGSVADALGRLEQALVVRPSQFQRCVRRMLRLKSSVAMILRGEHRWFLVEAPSEQLLRTRRSNGILALQKKLLDQCACCTKPIALCLPWDALCCGCRYGARVSPKTCGEPERNLWRSLTDYFALPLGARLELSENA